MKIAKEISSQEVDNAYPKLVVHSSYCIIEFEDSIFELSNVVLVDNDVIRHITTYTAEETKKASYKIIVNCGSPVPQVSMFDLRNDSCIASSFITHDKQDEINSKFKKLCF